MSNDLDVIRINTESWKNDLAQPTKIEQVQIEIFPLVPETHPALKKVLPIFDFQNPPLDPNKFASSLVETCKKHNGIGLSANQCGYEYRVFVMGSGDNYVAFYNPEIISVSEKTNNIEEGCLSFLDLFLTLERPEEIEVTYQDFNGERKTTKFTGITARCFQHELDHMNGIRFIDKVGPVAIQQARRKQEKLIKKIVRHKKK